MKLIKQVKISNFRSFYGTHTIKADELNVVFGKNDSGKSNIIRALNLYFNDETDIGQYYNHEIDFNSRRLEDSKKQKVRQQCSVEVTFDVPKNHRRSLGSSFSLQRSWGRDDYFNQFDPKNVKDKQGKIAQQSLTKFLNKIDFTAITAIKHEKIYQTLLAKYLIYLESDALSDAQSKLRATIEELAPAFLESLSGKIGGQAKIRNAVNIGDLFLGFDIGVGQDNHSLFEQKGDGIKVSYMIELLKEIAEVSQHSGERFHIWAIEEPENSLDLARAQMVASDLIAASKSNKIQSFITTHSPAFYALEEPCISKYFVEKCDDGEDVETAKLHKIENDNDAEKLMREAGLSALPKLGQELRELRRSKEVAEAQMNELKEDLEKLTKPVLLVEGKHDGCLFEALINATTNCSENFAIVPLGGGISTKNAREFANANTRTVAIFDNDPEGRSGYKASGGSNHGFNNLKNCLLPFTEHFEKFNGEYFANGTAARPCFVPEYYFLNCVSDEFLLDMLDHDCLHQEYNTPHQKWSNKLRNLNQDSEFYVYTRKLKDNAKPKYWRTVIKKISAGEVDIDPNLSGMMREVRAFLLPT